MIARFSPALRAGNFAGMLSGILATAILSGLYARGGMAWPLGFVMLAPWLYTLNARANLAGTMLSAWAMSIAFTLAVFSWFGMAIGEYTQAGAATGLSVLLLGAPLFQAQFLSFALVRYLAMRRYGNLLGALAGAAAWVATEWLLPKLLGDTLGHGLYPSAVLRQAADVGGAAGLSFLLILSNEAFASAWAQRTDGLRAYARPLALATLAPLLLTAYGLLTLANLPAPSGKPLRMGLIQANLVDYERQRQNHGSYEATRKVLDTHFAMSYDAVVRQRADAVLWSETTYPTTFGQPKSEAGAQLDQAILSIVNAAGVPFVFGTYERDATGEYNAAAFVAPGSGLLGFYRKTRLFPFTEYVPTWLDTPFLRRALPWTGNWQHGNGARVLPLRLADGREIPVLPLICRDDVDTALGIAGARLGAQAILTMSNDAWFSNYPQGAELHQAVAAFRSIETRLPQFRVTTNGYSGVIDASGNVQAASQMGQQTLVVGDISIRTPPATLMVRWGDWLGLAGLVYLSCLLLHATLVKLAAKFATWPTWRRYMAASTPTFPLKLAVLPPAARLAAGLLRTFARVSLLCLGIAILQDDALRGNTLAQIRSFTALFLLPEAAAWCVLMAFAARASIEHGTLLLTQGGRRVELALCDIVAVESWRLPLPSAGIRLRLASGAAWPYGLALANPTALVQALAQAGIAVQEQAPSFNQLYQQTRLAIRSGRLDQPFAKFVLLPFLLAFPAYYLHQHIAYGSGFGEFTSFGLKAYATGLAIWWAAWTIGVILFGALLRVAIEVGTLLAVLLRPSYALEMRRWFEAAAKVALYVGVPGWLLMRVFGA